MNFLNSLMAYFKLRSSDNQKNHDIRNSGNVGHDCKCWDRYYSYYHRNHAFDRFDVFKDE